MNSAIHFTPEDLHRLEGGDGLFELVDGVLVEKHMSFGAGDTVVTVSSLLNAFAKQQKLGKVVSEVTFRCFPEKPAQIRRPGEEILPGFRAKFAELFPQD